METPVQVIEATVQLEQADASGGRTVGTGFLLSAPAPDGPPKVLLVTAHHVLAGMAGTEARIGYRATRPDGSWRYTPEPLKVRDKTGAPLWTRHPTQDIAVMRISAPPEHARAAIPRRYLAGSASSGPDLAPGDELLVLGFPRGFAANTAGFPILRAGRVASYPLSPHASATFLVDFSVFPGNSGGPVFATPGLQRLSRGPAPAFIAGLLTQELELDNERLAIGVVTHARHIAETVDLVTGGAAPRTHAVALPLPGAKPAAQSSSPATFWERPIEVMRQSVWRTRKAAARALQRISERLVAWLEPSASRAARDTRAA